MLTFKVQTNLSEALAAAIGKAATRAEHIVAVQAAKDTSPYVPFLTGSLRNDPEYRLAGAGASDRGFPCEYRLERRHGFHV